MTSRTLTEHARPEPRNLGRLALYADDLAPGICERCGIRPIERRFYCASCDELVAEFADDARGEERHD